MMFKFTFDQTVEWVKKATNMERKKRGDNK